MIGDHLIDLLPHDRLIVVCGRRDDAATWRELLGPDRCLALPLDTAPLLPARVLSGATEQLAWQHQVIADLDRSGWLTAQADAFDPRREATLLFPDPLDPPEWGTRHRDGHRSPMLRVLENKTVVDSVWDAIGVRRAPSIVTDLPADLATLGLSVDAGAGVVCAVQSPHGTPSAGGDGIHWWHSKPPARADVAAKGTRVRLMPMLVGLPIRLHGLVTGQDAIAFPPLELVAPIRVDRGTFLSVGAVPTLPDHDELLAATGRAGEVLRGRLGYRGAFSIDGVLTAAGFRPTDLNTRLTSAMEAAPSALRVRLHLANVLARDGVDVDRETLSALAQNIFGAPQTYTLYGAAGSANDRPRDVLVRWRGDRLVVAYDDQIHGRLAITPSLRGWLLTATLQRSNLPAGPLNRLAPQIFELSDAILGTDFGDLMAPDDLPGPRRPVEAHPQPAQAREVG